MYACNLNTRAYERVTITERGTKEGTSKTTTFKTQTRRGNGADLLVDTTTLHIYTRKRSRLSLCSFRDHLTLR